MVWLAIGVGALVPAATRYAWAVQNINAMQVHLGHWVDAQLPKTARLALNDIGAIAFFSRREVIDLMGLVTPEIIPYRRRGESGVMRVRVGDVSRVRDHLPGVVSAARGEPETLAARSIASICERNEVAGAAEMVVYRLLRCAV